MTSSFRFTAVFALLGLGLFLAPAARAQQTSMPPGMSHEQHMAQMTHHFKLTPDGGSIAVDANDPADETSRDQIRVHLKEIAVAFGQGDFQKLSLIHI